MLYSNSNHFFSFSNPVKAGCCWFQTQNASRPSCFEKHIESSLKTHKMTGPLFPQKSAVSALFDGFDLMASDFDGYSDLLDNSDLMDIAISNEWTEWSTDPCIAPCNGVGIQVWV